MTELEKIEYTKGFVDKLAEWINPIDGTPIAEGDLLNNVRISRCMYYVSDILRRVIENGGIEGKKPAKRGRAPFALSDSARRGLIPADEPLRISQVTSLINEKVDPETMKSLRSGVITRWLLGIGALEEVQLPSGKTTRLPTPQGRGLGLITQEFRGENSVYSVVLYKPEAQQFIFDNIDAIEQLNREKSGGRENGGKPWSTQDDETLGTLVGEGVEKTEIARTLGRTVKAVNARLERLGLDVNVGDAPQQQQK